MSSRDILNIEAANDQDHSELKDWLREAPPESIVEVWNTIQADYADSPCLQVLTRFAQYGFATLWAEHVRESEPPHDDR